MTGDTANQVLDHLPCGECAYDLHGISSDNVCPECGQAVAISVRQVAARRELHTSLSRCDPRWLRQLSSGLALLGVAVVWSAIASGCWDERSRLIVGLSIIPVWTLELWAIWILAKPCPRGMPDRKWRLYAIRALSVILLITPVLLMRPNYRGADEFELTNYWAPFGDYPYSLRYLVFILNIWMLFRLQHLALRLGALRLRRQFQILLVIWPLLQLACAYFFVRRSHVYAPHHFLMDAPHPMTGSLLFAWQIIGDMADSISWFGLHGWLRRWLSAVEWLIIANTLAPVWFGTLALRLRRRLRESAL